MQSKLWSEIGVYGLSRRTHQCACVVEPGVVVVEVALGGVVRLVGDVVQLEHEGEICQTPHLHLRRFTRVAGRHHSANIPERTRYACQAKKQCWKMFQNFQKGFNWFTFSSRTTFRKGFYCFIFTSRTNATKNLHFFRCPVLLPWHWTQDHKM